MASSWVSNLGDGFALSAGPLLVASQTRNPTLVAFASLLLYLPWLLFSLVAGALADRLNRRRIVAVVDLARALALVVLAVAILVGWVSIALILVTLFLLGTAEVFGNSAFATLLPMLVDRADLPIANARFQAGFVVVDQLAGPAIGAALFATAHWVPFVGQAVLVGAGVWLILRVRLPAVQPRAEQTRMRADVVEGVRWVLHHPAVRTLVLTILTFNITFGAAWSVLVLYARQRLGLGSVGFGLITTVMAVGGVAGTLGYGRLIKHISLGDLMRVGLVIETFTHLALALTTHAGIALVIFFVFGAHAYVWGTTSISIRQRAVPLELQGRVGSVNALGTFAGIVVGAAMGGPIASHWGITAPFWFAFVGSAVFVVAIWRQLVHIAHTDEAAVAQA
jgi:predicted MFS family arabinose efflux permease